MPPKLASSQGITPRFRWVTALLALSLLANLAAVWGTWQRRADHLRKLAGNLAAANASAAAAFGPSAHPLPATGGLPGPSVEALNLVGQLGLAEAAAQQVYRDYGLDFGSGNRTASG